MGNAPMQLVNFRSEAVGIVAKPALSKLDRVTNDLEQCVISRREVYFEETGAVECPVYDRALLGRIGRVDGPCIVEQMDSTSVIPPRTYFEVDEYGNIIVTVSEMGAKEGE